MKRCHWFAALLGIAALSTTACGGTKSRNDAPPKPASKSKSSSAKSPPPSQAQCILDQPSVYVRNSTSFDTRCSQKQLKSAHRKAQALLAGGKAHAALTYLVNVEKALKCQVDTGRETINIAAYELSVLQLKAQLATKRCAECGYFASYLNRPYYGGLQNQIDMNDHDMTKAERLQTRIEAIATVCWQRYRTLVADFTATPCTMAGVKGIAVPRVSLPAGVSAACLEHAAPLPASAAKTVPAEHREDPELAARHRPCRRLLLHTQSPTGKHTIHLRTPKRTPRKDGLSRARFKLEALSSCCNEYSLSVARRSGKNALRVIGDEEDCYGGNARTSVDIYYYWTKHGLTEWVSHGAGLR